MPAARVRHRVFTWVYALLLGLLVVLLFNPFSTQNPLQQFHYAGESAGRMLDRHMEFYAGYEQVAPWEQALHTFLFGSRAQVADEVINNYREVLAFFVQHPQSATPWAALNTRSRLLVTLAETGRLGELRQMLDEPSPSPEQDVINDALNFAYYNSGTANMPSVVSGGRMMPLGWASDMLWLRIAQRSHDRMVEDYTWRRHLENGQRLRDRVRYLSLSVAVVIGLGGLLWVWQRRRVLEAYWPGASLAQPWGLYEGAAVAIRAALLGLLIMVILQLLANQYFRPGLLASWSTLFASLPMVWLIRRGLLRARGQTLRHAFGLSPLGAGGKSFVVVTLAFLAVEWCGTLVISWLSWKLGASSQWTEGINERMFFGPNSTVILAAINVVLWAPLFEELGFRGLLFTTLRGRYKAGVSILVTALLFAALHMYSLSGFLSVLWSGMVLAFIYNRYHSLLPGMVIHAADNILSLSILLLFYR